VLNVKKIINYFKIKKEKKDFQCLLKKGDFDAGRNKEGVWLGNVVCSDGTISELVENNLENPIAFISKSGSSKEQDEYIVPTLLKTWQETAIIFDVLGNVEKLTSSTRAKKFNNKIIKFSPCEERTDRYNFLSEIRLLTKHEKNDVIDIVISFIEDFYGFSKENLSLFERKKLEVENEQISSFLSSIIFYNLYKSFLKNSTLSMKEVYEFIKKLSFIEKPSSYFKNILSENIFEKYSKNENNKTLVKKWIEKAQKEYNYKGLPFENFFRCYSVSDNKKLKLIIEKTLNLLKIFEKENYSKNTEESDFTINEIINSIEPITLYFETKPFDIIDARVFFKIFVKQFISKAEENNSKNNILMVFNQFLEFGHFGGISEIINTAKKYKIKTFFNFSAEPEDKIYKAGFLKENFPIIIRDYDFNEKKKTKNDGKEVFCDGPGSRMFLFEEVTRKPDESLFLEIDFKKNIKIKKVAVEKNEKL